MKPTMQTFNNDMVLQQYPNAKAQLSRYRQRQICQLGSLDSSERWPYARELELKPTIFTPTNNNEVVGVNT